VAKKKEKKKRCGYLMGIKPRQNKVSKNKTNDKEIFKKYSEAFPPLPSCAQLAHPPFVICVSPCCTGH